MKPSIGSQVHYVSYGTPGGEYTSQCRTAVVTEVSDTESYGVGLCVFNPTGLFFHPVSDGAVFNDETEHMGGTWHWPERIED